MQYYVVQLVPLLTALVTCASMTPVVRCLALRLGMVDMPGPRKIHMHPMPLLGGLSICVAVLLTVVVFVDGGVRGETLAVLGAATFLLVVGVLDDKGLLHHQVKLLGAMPLAAILLMMAGIRVDVLEKVFASSGGALQIFLQVLDYGITLFWVVGITAAFNILDHMDGLCAGIAGVAALFYWWIAVANGHALVALLALAVIGAALGFLWWNFNPAKIFMGDGGAMFLGFIMAALGLKLHLPDVSPSIQWMVPVLVLGVPIFDTTLVTVSRLRRGLVPFRSPGKDHTAHRLTNVGLSQRRAVMLMYCLGVISGLLALIVTRISPWQAYLLFALVFMTALLLLIGLEYLPFEGKDSKNRGDMR